MIDTATFLKEAAANQQMMTEARHYLHSHPGTGFDLAETVAFVKKSLEDMGYAPKECGKAGLTVTAGGRHPGKVFLHLEEGDGRDVFLVFGIEMQSDDAAPGAEIGHPFPLFCFQKARQKHAVRGKTVQRRILYDLIISDEETFYNLHGFEKRNGGKSP